MEIRALIERLHTGTNVIYSREPNWKVNEMTLFPPCPGCGYQKDVRSPARAATALIPRVSSCDKRVSGILGTLSLSWVARPKLRNR